VHPPKQRVKPPGAGGEDTLGMVSEVGMKKLWWDLGENEGLRMCLLQTQT